MPIISGGGSGGTGGAISGVTITGTAAAGNVPIASSSSAGTWAVPPGGEIGYDQITTSVTVSSTNEAAGTTVISAAAHTFDGSPVIAEFFAPACATAAAAGGTLIISLFEGATQIARLVAVVDPVTGTQPDFPCIGKLRFTPTAASHTYTVTAFEASGSATVVAGVGGTAAYAPAYIRFTKV